MKSLLIVFGIFLLLIPASHGQNLLLQKQFSPEKIPAGTKLSFFVQGNEQQIKQYLQQNKGTYKYAFRGYHHIAIPAEKVKDLSQQDFISYIDYHHQVPVALNDSMRVKARVNQVHQGLAPLPQGYTGKNILIGLIDDGIDFNHPDFKDSSGNTRVMAIWDQTQTFDSTRTPAYGYGQVWDSTDINNGSCTSTETSGHGTTVSGTAAGNGFSTGTHQGVAPDALIVMVKSNFSMPNWSATVADAADFIYHLADSLGLPCSINASVGDYYGTHDGTDLPSQYIDSLIKAKRGRLFSAALGNSGTFSPYHLRTDVVATDTSFTWFKYNAPGGGDAFPYGVVFFEAFADTADMQNVWFSVGADQVSPTYKHRGQSVYRNAFDFINTTVTDTIWSTTGNELGIVDYYAEVLPGGILSLQVHMQEPDSNAYYFRFSTTGSGAYDVWSDEWMGISKIINTVPDSSTFPDIVHYVSPDSAKTMVNGPQCLESVMTVANYNNIQDYIGYDGNPVSLGEVEGDICSTSSRGPTRDNRQKPDVAATGNVTFSPGPLPILSALITVAPSKLLPDGMHMRNGGTSMASPVLAGIGALMLERCPQTNWLEFKTHVNTSAYTDTHTGVVPNISFGFGKVNAYDALVQTVYTPVLTGDTAICAGDIAELLAPGDFQEFVWSNGDSTYATSLDTNGQLWFTGIDAAGCITDTATISVNVHPIPVVTFTSSGGTLTAHSPGTVVYQWYENGTPLAGENDSTYTPTGINSYYVTASDNLGCTGYSDTLNLAGVDENENPVMGIYPNPFNEILNIVTTETIRIEIRNSLGELMTMTSEHTIATRSWSRGIYLVRIVHQKGESVFKLVKQ